MARSLKVKVEDARDENSVTIPDIKKGNTREANYVLGKLGINKRMPKENAPSEDITPNVVGMGARDAVYMLENRGLRVKVHGRGKVKKQSYPAGKQIVEGSECVLILE